MIYDREVCYVAVVIYVCTLTAAGAAAAGAFLAPKAKIEAG